MNRLIREEMDFQQRRFYRRLKVRDKLVVEFWPGAKKFLDSIPGIAWEKQGNKILIKEKTNTMKTFRDIVTEGIKKSEGYALTGEDNVVIVKGGKKDMHKLRKEKGTGFTVWNSPGSKVGDTLK
jgi:hypothetical protein